MTHEGHEEIQNFSQKLACTHCGLSFDELAPRNFSFNSPYGACQTCDGLGTRLEVDPELVVPDADRTLNDGALAPWASATLEYWHRVLEAVAAAHGFDLDTPWKKLPKATREILLYGSDEQIHVRYKNRYGRQRAYWTTFEGAIANIERRHAETDSDAARDRLEQFMRQIPCRACGGARLRPETLAVTIGGQNISYVTDLAIRDALAFIDDMGLSEREQMIAERLVKEIRARLGFLVDVGLDYLTLGRAAGTLAGGEAQRIRLATQIGSGLVGVLYILDEPSIGLHQRDNRRLLDTLLRLRDLGNTLIVVEHDEATIIEADHIVDIGPAAGEHGGEIVYEGDLKGLLEAERSITGAFLSGRRSIPVPRERRAPGERKLVLAGAREHNLAERDRRDPARPVRVRDRGQRFRQVHPRAGRLAAGARAEGVQLATASRQAQAPDRLGAHRQGDRHRPVADRAHAALEPGHVHRVCSTTSASSSRRSPRPRSAGSSPGGSRSTCGAAAARTARATARSRSRCTSCPTCT